MASRVLLLPCALALALVLSFSMAAAQLSPSGRNVCNRDVSYNVYSVKQSRKIAYENYRTCCKKFWGICTSRCTRTRSKMVTYYKKVLSVRSRRTYFCCAGWAPAGSECTKPICNPACKNGDCVQPNKCQCRSGFQGNYCQSDIDECANKPCQQTCANLPGSYACSCTAGYRKTSSQPTHPSCADVNECTLTPCTCATPGSSCKATCSNSVGSFSCACNPGYQLISGQRICKDIDECSTPAQNRCQHKCLNSLGAFSCACETGYLLAADKKACNDIDECLTLNGGCSQVCNNRPGTFFCSCNTGFRLNDNKRVCNDIDECSEGTPCDASNGICTNTRGSYQCTCRLGYQLQSDQKTCKDIDECQSNSTNSCEHHCHNNAGSYTCSCRPGYRLNVDLRSCDDVDECKEGTATCAHRCHNNIGSYTCSCRPGYQLESDVRSCRALPCVSIKAPLFGSMNCSGLVTDESCQLACNHGYNLFGSALRTCQPSTAWSGERTLCSPKPCPDIVPPQHGSVLLPCIQEFASNCLVKCNQGYHLSGSRITDCVMPEQATTWTGSNVTCNANTACQPNPCQHGGTCLASGASFTCNCKGTMFTGDTCAVGVVEMPSFGPLETGVLSGAYSISARPDNMLTITFASDDQTMEFVPPYVTIRYPDTSTSFRMLSNRAGSASLSYTLGGIDGPSFQAPSNDIIYSIVRRSNAKPVYATTAFLDDACKSRHAGQCPGAGGQSLQYTSTCSWGPSTSGFVGTLAGNKRIPLSVTGMTSTTADAIYSGRIVDPSNGVRAYLSKGQLSACPASSQCSGLQTNIDAVDYIAHANLFMRSYFSAFNELMPFGLDLRTTDSSRSYEVGNLRALLGRGDRLTTANVCPTIDFRSSDVYTVFSPSTSAAFHFLSSVKDITTTESPFCAVVDACGRSAAFGLPRKQSLSFSNDLASMGLTNVLVEVRSFSVALFSTKSCVNLETALPGNNCVHGNAQLNVALELKKSFDLAFDGKMTAELRDLSQLTLKKLDDELAFVMRGRLAIVVRMRLFGMQMTLSVADDNGEGIVRIGGSSTACPLCLGRGIYASVDSKTASFSYSSSVVRFLPASGKMQVSLPYDVTSGSVTHPANARLLLLRVRALESLKASIVALQPLLSVSYSADYNIITRHTNVLVGRLSTLKTLLSDASVSYVALQGAVASAKDSALDTTAAVQYLSKRLGSDPQSSLIRNRLRIINLRLKQVSQMQVLPSTLPFNEVSQGAVLFYRGSLCLHKLCFTDSDVTVYDVNAGSPSCNACNQSHRLDNSANAINVIIKPRTPLMLGDVIKVNAGSEIRMQIKRNELSYSTQFEAEVELFGMSRPCRIRLNEAATTFEAHDVIVGKVLFNVQGSVDTSKATWDTLVNTVRATSSNQSAAIATVSDAAQQWFESTAAKTQSRVEGLTSRTQIKTSQLVTLQNDVEEKRMELRMTTTALRSATNEYRRQLMALNVSQTTLQSYITSVSDTFIRKTLDNVCVLSECKKKCVSMPTCEICQTPVKADVDTLKCSPVVERMQTSHVVPYSTSCAVTKYVFIPVYTGSCAEDPGMAAQRDAQLQRNLVATGSAVGAAVGSIIPVIGTALGSVIGAVVGFVAGLFSSCDRSYEVYTKTFTVQEPCTLTKVDVVTTERTIAECFTVKKSVVTGYSKPKECNCKMDTCVAKVTVSACIVENTACQRQRAVFLAGWDKVPKQYKDTFLKVQQLKSNVKAAQTKRHQLERQKKFDEAELRRAEIMATSKAQESRFANASLANVASLIPQERCILSLYETSHLLTNHVIINEFGFTTSLPVVGSFQMDAFVTVVGSGSKATIPLRMDLQDPDLSLVGNVKTIVTSSLCASARSRRSTLSVIPGDDAMTFTSWFVDASLNATAAQQACVTFKRTTGFLAAISQQLREKMSEDASMATLIQTSRNSLSVASSALSNSSNDNSNDTVLLAERALVNSVEASLAVLHQRTEPAQTVSQWLEQAEIFTVANNYSFCFDFDDCADVAFNSLRHLPTMLKVSRLSYIALVNQTESALATLLSSNVSHNGLSTALKEFDLALDSLNASSLHCAQPPQVSLGKEANVSASLGGVIQLNCDVISDLPVLAYKWRQHEAVIATTNVSTLPVVTSQQSDGVYSCEAFTVAGSRQSTGTNVIIHGAAKILVSPQPVVHALPSHPQVRPTFVCNATGKPSPAIAWYFISQTDATKSGTLLSGETSQVLVITNVTDNTVGSYYCTASNKYGSAKSTEARLDVVRSSLSQQSIKFCFNLTSSNESMLNGSSFAIVKERLRVDPRQVIAVRWSTGGEGGGQLCSTISISPAMPANASHSSLLDVAVKARQSLANSIATVLRDIVMNSSTVAMVDGTMLAVDNESFAYAFDGARCQSGHVIQKNGFICVECPSGHFQRSNTCLACPPSSYQQMTGQMNCLRCGHNQVTEKTASNSPIQCIDVGSYCRGRKDGQYRMLGHCDKFFSCSGGYTYVMRCPSGLRYSEKGNHCDWPWNVTCQSA